MNANKQDAGVPMWPTDPWEALRRIEEMGGSAGYIARECIRRNGEQCRAAPAGGDPICPECKAPGLLFECVACSHSNYPKDSAPAGSGEVDALVQKLYEDAARFNSVEVGYRDMMKIRAALLRKLQQGADSADAARYRKLKPMMLSADFEPEDYVGLTFALPAGTCVMANLDSILDGIASQGQEGGHARD